MSATQSGGSDFHAGVKLGPGIYDWQGEIHVDRDELILGAGGDPRSAEDVAAVLEGVKQAAAERGIPLEFER